ncbi:hypothetical protein QC764_0051600 [Podospora pseudoanserina]|uniref:Uncharacterized protein n=1 Tax=Podospora pseudoanserina TaxID=2609844 RepID=A0ABR0ICH4_9PEZI|nr:hypothetical protein QC764_0051600 [Podospora pseudoanserina]
MNTKAHSGTDGPTDRPMTTQVLVILDVGLAYLTVLRKSISIRCLNSSHLLSSAHHPVFKPFTLLLHQPELTQLAI